MVVDHGSTPQHVYTADHLAGRWQAEKPEEVLMAKQIMEDQQQKGLECPRCGCRHFEVLHTIRLDKLIRRRRGCRNCGRLIMTTERIDDAKDIKS